MENKGVDLEVLHSDMASLFSPHGQKGTGLAPRYFGAEGVAPRTT